MSYKKSFRDYIHLVDVKSLRPGILSSLLFVTIFSILVSGCKKTELTDPLSDDLMKAAGIEQITPANQASDVVLNPLLTVTFKNGTDPSVIQSSVLTLKSGTSTVDGKMTVSGTTATFKPVSELMASGDYTAVISTEKSGSKSGDHGSEYTWKFRTGDHHHYDLKVVSVVPLNGSTDIPLTTTLAITFNQELSRGMKSAISLLLKSGTVVTPGTLSFDGNKATFKPSADLTAGSVYTVTVITGSAGHDDHESDHSYTWSFTTTGGVADVTPPTILSVTPAVNATSVAVTGKLTVNFSETMTPSTINATTFTLSQGTTPVPGTVAGSGATATFTPAASLAFNTVYNATVTTGVKDAAGNNLTTAYTWSYTTAAGATADVTPPTVLSVVPTGGATSIAVTSAITATFSEALNASTVNSATFTLMQGTTSVSGTVSYSGVTAKFTPAAALANNTVYTVTITTGVKDVAGNSLAAAKVWSFTTIAAMPAGMSFANDVVPVLNMCNNCHTHGWTTSPIASTFYTNLATAGYVNATSPTTSKIYVKLNTGHPGSSMATVEINKILTWMNEGSRNN
jgi:hypothetical protein